MEIVVSIIFVIMLAKLVMVAAMEPRRSSLSQFEIDRLKKGGDKEAGIASLREGLAADIISIKRVILALLIVIISALTVYQWGWLIGVALALVIAVTYGRIARIKWVQRFSQKLYDRHEARILAAVSKYPWLIRLVRSSVADGAGVVGVNSRQELEHLVSHSGEVLSSDEKKLILNSLTMDAKSVSEIMTPRSVIEGISVDELLGPLVLDDLHKTGHSRFPVIKDDLDHIVGILYIQNLFNLKDQQSTTAEQAMEPNVYYIRQDQTLAHALVAFIKTRHHLFIVVNEYRETVGIVSLEDVMEAILGRKIIDEFDRHDDLRTVAARNTGRNNLPINRHDV